MSLQHVAQINIPSITTTTTTSAEQHEAQEQQDHHSRNVIQLLQLCEQYKVASWITNEQYHMYHTILLNHPYDYDTYQYIVQEITMITQQQSSVSQQQQPMSSSIIPPTTNNENINSSSPEHTNHNNNNNKTNHHDDHHHKVHWNDNDNEALSTKQPLLQQQQQQDKMIYLPHEILSLQHETHGTTYNHNNTNTTSTIWIQQLFVEMCFYARLGYIQPPCCLYCLYTNTNTNEQQKHPKCTRWVIWRKDTNIVLHPDTIQDNIVMIPCYIVQQLLCSKQSSSSSLQYSTTDGYYWDCTTKQLQKK